MEEKLKDEDEIEIDLGRLFGILADRKKIVAAIIISCTFIAMVCSLMISPTYESNTLVQTHSANKLDVSGASAVISMLSGNSGVSSSTSNYIELMKSRAVLDPVMDQLEDITPEQRERMNANAFAKGNLEIENVKGTNLINVIGKGRSPEEAQMISASVVENFLKIMTELNQSSQSYMVKFLNGRIETTKKESDNASSALEQYGREHKVYMPEDQMKAIVEREAVYNKTLSELLVQQQAAGAQIEAASSELGKQNAKMSAFNIADESVVVALREQIVTQEVTIVQMEQKFTDNHPELRNAREQLAALKNRLSQEVADAVASGTASMNPTQSALVQSMAQAQVDMAVASASEAAIRAQMAEADSDMAQLSEEALEYLNLKRDADIKNEVYIALVKQSEQAKIEATMDSMDIQVIDKANLPLYPSSPKKKLITLGGMIVGIIISIIYGLWLYKKEESIYNN